MIPHCGYHPHCPPRQSSFSSLSFLCGLAPNPEETHGVVLLRSVCALPPYHLLCFLNLAWTFSSRPSRLKVPPEFWIAFLLLPSSCCNSVVASTYLRTREVVDPTVTNVLFIGDLLLSDAEPAPVRRNSWTSLLPCAPPNTQRRDLWCTPPNLPWRKHQAPSRDTEDLCLSFAR